jgi:pimeloyl-ACP methyl ester carboxylesterase
MAHRNSTQERNAMTQTTATEVKTVHVPGAELYVESRGSGPVLLLVTGGPTDAGMFADLADRLADRYTVVSYDQRGHSRSPLDGEPDDILSAHAEDAAAILRATAEEPAYVYGNSGGGTIGLELVARHPKLVRTLVAHEPPLFELLPDAEEWRSKLSDISETYVTEGVFAAMGKFGAVVEEGGPKYSEEMAQAPTTPESQELAARMMGNFDLFIAHELPRIGGHVPDVDALRAAPTRIVSAAGETSREQAARRASIALAERLGSDVTYLPGAHGGWGSDPREFAERLDEVLRG